MRIGGDRRREGAGAYVMTELSRADQVRTHCLSGRAKIRVTKFAGVHYQFTYVIQTHNDRVSWWVKGWAKRPAGAKPSRHDGTRGSGDGWRFRNLLKIGADFKLAVPRSSRFGPEHPIHAVFVEFYDLVFRQNVMHPFEFRIEALALDDYPRIGSTEAADQPRGAPAEAPRAGGRPA